MRLTINLASQKYEDVRRFYVRWSTAIGLTAVLMVLLLFFREAKELWHVIVVTKKTDAGILF